MSNCKTVLFYRPVQVGDIAWEIEVPVEIIKKGDKAVIEWIMANRGKLKQLSKHPETYTLKEELSPKGWDSWEVSITPAINIEEGKNEQSR